MLADPDWWSLPAVQLAGWMAERLSRSPVGSPSRPTHSCVGRLGGSPGVSSSHPTHSCVGRLEESTGSCSHSRSSRLSPSWGRDSREERRCARSRSRGSRSRSTARLRTRGWQRSCCDSSHFPSARVRSCRSRLNSWDRRVHSRSWSDRSRSCCLR